MARPQRVSCLDVFELKKKERGGLGVVGMGGDLAVGKKGWVRPQADEAETWRKQKPQIFISCALAELLIGTKIASDHRVSPARAVLPNTHSTCAAHKSCVQAKPAHRHPLLSLRILPKVIPELNSNKHPCFIKQLQQHTQCPELSYLQEFRHFTEEK